MDGRGCLDSRCSPDGGGSDGRCNPDASMQTAASNESYQRRHPNIKKYTGFMLHISLELFPGGSQADRTRIGGELQDNVERKCDTPLSKLL